MKKQIGSFGVDSGQVLIGDPCYLKDFEHDNMDVKRTYKHATENKFVVWPKDFTRYDEYKEDGLDMNTLVKKGIYKEVPRKINRSYSYGGACSLTIDGEDSAGELENGLAVVASTGYGDGCYPVIADIQDGVIHSLTIQFIDPDEDEDEDELCRCGIRWEDCIC